MSPFAATRKAGPAWMDGKGALEQTGVGGWTAEQQ
jgi:hypothetical protein